MKFKALMTWMPAAFLLLMIPVCECLAGENNEYTLEESIAEALENNWALKAKKEKIEQAGYAKKQAGAEFLPKLSTSYSYTRLDKVSRSAAVPLGLGTQIPARDNNTQDNYQWKFTVTQPLFTGFALVTSYQLAKLGIDQTELELEQEKLDIALKAKDAYFGILKADKALEVAQKAVESLESHVRVARSFYKVGMIPINDLLKAEVELGNAKYDLVKACNACRLARSAFNIVLSRPISAPVVVKDVVLLKLSIRDFEDYLTDAFENRPEMELLDVNITQTEKQIRLAQSAFFPEVALQYDYIKEGDTPGVAGSSFHDDSLWQAMAVATWTFWEWGKTLNAAKEKESLKNELILTKKALEDSISLEVKDAVLALEEAEKNIPTTEKAVEQAEENLRVSQERYKAQVTTSTEVLDAQTLLTQARTNYYNAVYDKKLARARLKRALGTY